MTWANLHTSGAEIKLCQWSLFFDILSQAGQVHHIEEATMHLSTTTVRRKEIRAGAKMEGYPKSSMIKVMGQAQICEGNELDFQHRDKGPP